MLILALESSCDETAVALVEDGRAILASVISSQVDLHARYGGVVPELASRQHVDALHWLLQEALDTAGKTLADIDAIAVTAGPGLQGALLVGLAAGQTLAWLLGKPLIGVNHLEGHIYANFLAFDAIPFPLLVLLVSGGHTQLVEMSGHRQYRLLGETRDDAVGEAFDKVARLLDLPYPGGPEIDRRARLGNPKAFTFPRSMMDQADFSFSGLKTAVLYTLRDLKEAGKEIPVDDLCASFQEAAVIPLVRKTVRYAHKHKIPAVAVSGGVSANSRLREMMQAECGQFGIQCFIPPLALCTDNAAMIGACAWYKWQQHPRDEAGSLTVKARLPLGQP